jgi:hypothetical protein
MCCIDQLNPPPGAVTRFYEPYDCFRLNCVIRCRLASVSYAHHRAFDQSRVE